MSINRRKKRETQRHLKKKGISMEKQTGSPSITFEQRIVKLTLDALNSNKV